MLRSLAADARRRRHAKKKTRARAKHPPHTHKHTTPTHTPEHFSHRAPWLRAFILGANDGLVSVASLIVGVSGGSTELRAMQLAGVAGLVGGALSMACGECVSERRLLPLFARACLFAHVRATTHTTPAFKHRHARTRTHAKKNT